MSLLTEINGAFNLSEYGKLSVIGCTDEITVCFCCGKEGLKKTAVMQDSEGNYSFFGTTCAYNASTKWETSKKKNHKFKLPVELEIGRFLYRYNFETANFECFNPNSKQWGPNGAKSLQIMLELKDNRSSLKDFDQVKLNFFLDKLEEHGQLLPF